VLAAAGACGRQPPVEQVVWSPAVGRELRGAYGGGDVAQDAAGTWLAYEEETSLGEWRIRVRHLGSADHPTRADPAARITAGAQAARAGARQPACDPVQRRDGG
jgi:hypothetical protein